MNLKYIKIIAASVLLYSANAAALQAEEIAIWENCVKEAKFQNPDLAAARDKIDQNIAAKEVTRSAYLPQINTNFSESSKWQSHPAAKTIAYAYDITGKQLLFDGFKVSYDLFTAQRNINAARYNYDVTSSTVRLNLRTAFANLLNAQELVNVADGILKRRQQNYALVKLRYEGGLEHKGSLMKSEADVAQAEYELAQAKRDIYSSQVLLIRTIGRSNFQATDIIANGDFEVKDKEAVRPDFEKLAVSNPFLSQLIQKKEAAKYGYKAANADFFPQIYANAAGARSDNVWPPKTSAWTVGTSASFSIFDGGKKFANVAQTLATWKQTQADERSGKDSIIYTMANTWATLQDAIANVYVQKKYLDAARERAKISEAEYSIGLLSYDNWIIIEDNYVSAKKNYLSAQTSALIAEANWIQAKGGTLDYDKT
ncbi:MAG: TolC family protein [Candidatus Omnitrophica bacterium]|nr:TolC family protein [Candidatus Omnitrophota bacterium]